MIVGGRSRTRTYDPLIKSQLLYHLSYAPLGPAITAANWDCPLTSARALCLWKRSPRGALSRLPRKHGEARNGDKRQGLL